MHCKACDNELSTDDITFNEVLNDFEICPTCLHIALDAAHSNKFDVDDGEEEYVILGDDDDGVPMVSTSTEEEEND